MSIELFSNLFQMWVVPGEGCLIRGRLFMLKANPEQRCRRIWIHRVWYHASIHTTRIHCLAYLYTVQWF